ncbi:MAG: GTPase ObgE [Deltaproteobacteria bacterium]|nr:GTPase ObgE [Deltaproteobacteria bacterium]
MRFIDEVKISVVAGNGGSGCVSWRREKFVPFGGPDGGNGGSGGSVIFQAESGLNTLIDFSFNPIITAENGNDGEANQRTGKNGLDTICKVPVGTQVFFGDKLVADISSGKARWIAARGGNGGKGNAFFKSAVNQAPDFAQTGQAGEKFEFTLILKSIADVGLVGLPNVGKSTFIASISAASPKIADYPFTTLRPNLGVVDLGEDRKFVVADIPGLIPGAHLGKGLGITFLKHIERTKVLAQFIDVSVDSAPNEREVNKAEKNDDTYIVEAAIRQFKAIDNELGEFSATLIKLPRIIVFSKGDLSQSEKAYNLTRGVFEEMGFKSYLISAINKQGIKNLLEELYKLIRR